MIVKCISEYPNEEQLAMLGNRFYKNQSFGIEVNKEYLVLAISYHINDSAYGSGVYVHYLDLMDECHLRGLILQAPLFLFEIIDNRASKYWECRQDANGSAHLMPPSFYRDYYYDDFSEDVPDVVDDFRKVYTLLDAEAHSE